MIEPINFEIVTKNISIVNNNLPKGQFAINPIITRNTGTIGEDKVFTEIILIIKNTEEKPFPFDITVQMMGIFERKNIPEESLENFLEVQAVQIIMPYVRAAVSSLTTAAFMPPLVLPVFDVPSIFPKADK